MHEDRKEDAGRWPAHLVVPVGRLLMSVVSAYGVEYSYSAPGEEVHALRGVDLTVARGEFACVFGASGSGKSTLLSLLAGLDTPSAGTVEVAGTTLSALGDTERTAFRLANVGMVFQDHNLIAQLTAVENVELLLRCRGVEGARAVALTALKAVGLADQAHRRPTEMSGGQRQRVGIARAIAGGRPLVLCDEPTGSLDSNNGDQVFKILRGQASENGTTVLVATHDPQALEYADTQYVIADGTVVSRRTLTSQIDPGGWDDVGTA